MRLIRKWYFKIYHLLKLLGIFILIFGFKSGVYAADVEPIPDSQIEAETSCSINLVEPTVFEGMYKSSSIAPIVDERYTYYSTYLIKVKPNTLYTYYSSYGSYSTSYYVWLFDDINTRYTMRQSKTTTTGTITTDYSTNYIALGQYFPRSDMTPSDLYFGLYEGNYTGEFVEFESCTPTPEPEESIYSGFLTLYTDKLTYLAEGFTSNPYLKAMIGIIFAWIVLELFLKILNIRGGKR